MRVLDVSRPVLKLRRAQLLATVAVLALAPGFAQAQQSAPAKPAMTPAADESLIDQIADWFKRSDKAYQDEVIKKLSEPTAPNPVTDAQKKLEADRSAAAKAASKG